MIEAWRAVRALARVELRQVSRHRGRSLLVVLLVALPVAAIVGGSTLAHISEPTAEERSVAAMGRAEVRIDGVSSWEALERARGLLPPKTRTERVFIGLERVAIPGRRLRARLYAAFPAAWGPEGAPTAPAGATEPGLAHGLIRLVEGRWPAHSGEVALSETLLSGLDSTLGDRVTLSFGPARTVTGVVADPEDLSAPVVVRTPAAVEYRGVHSLLADVTPAVAAETVEAARSAGFTASSRQEAAVPDHALIFFAFVLGTIGLLEAALVISAAFAIGIRRRQVEIGLLGSTGATPRGLVVALLLSAGVLAVAGGVLGILLGVGGAAAIHPWLDGLRNRFNGPFEVVPGHLAGALFLGVVAAVSAAVLPARNAARLPVRDALAGRRPPLRRTRVWLGWGASMIATGLVLLVVGPRGSAPVAALSVVGGPMLGIVGAGVASPWLLAGLARRAGVLPLTWRLAVRDAGRFRERNGAVVTAVLAGMSMSVVVAALVASIESRFADWPKALRDDQLLVEGPGAESVAQRLVEALPVVAASPWVAAYVHGEPVRARFGSEPAARPRQEWVAVGDDDLLRTLGIDGAGAELKAGRLLALDPPTTTDPLKLTAWVAATTLESPGVASVVTKQRVQAPLFVLSHTAAAALGFATGPPPRDSLVPWVVRLTAPATAEHLRLARGIAAPFGGTTVDAERLHAQPIRASHHVVLGLCVLTGLLVVVVATALSAAESVADERVLRAVGAAPRVLRGHLAARAGYLALLGCALAVPAGLMTSAAVLEAADIPLTFTVPWRDVVAIVTVLPAVVYLVTWWLGMAFQPGSAPWHRRPGGAWS